MTIQKPFFIIAFNLLTLFSCGQSNNTVLLKKDSIVTAKNLDTIVYNIAIPPTDKDGMFPTTKVEVNKHNGKLIFLKFQAGGTETNIGIIDSIHSHNYKSIWDTPPAKRLDFGHNESGLLDISDLANGTYFVRYMSCNIGGTYLLTLTN